MESGGHGQRPLKGVASVKELCAAGRAEHLGFGGSDPAAVEAGMPIPQAQFVRIAGACERLTTSVCWVQSSLTGAPDMTPPPSAPTMKGSPRQRFASDTATGAPGRVRTGDL